jgi:uncharacterized protein (TIGR03084 family)
VDDVLTALSDQIDELGGLVAPLDAAGWAAPSACAGWSVSDVVLHLAQTNEMALGSLDGRMDEVITALAGDAPPAADVDEGAERMVARERGAPGPDVLARWRSGADELVAGLGAGDPSRRVTWVAGQLSVRTLATTRLAETWIHTGDVAFGLGQPPSATDRLWHIARLAWRTLPYAFARAGRPPLAGPVAVVLRAPDGSTWTFGPEPGSAPAATTVEGDALDLCLVAGQRAEAAETGLRASGPDADAVLDLVRTFA